MFADFDGLLILLILLHWDLLGIKHNRGGALSPSDEIKEPSKHLPQSMTVGIERFFL